jgi:hypothetical protein
MNAAFSEAFSAQNTPSVDSLLFDDWRELVFTAAALCWSFATRNVLVGL